MAPLCTNRAACQNPPALPRRSLGDLEQRAAGVSVPAGVLKLEHGDDDSVRAGLDRLHRTIEKPSTPRNLTHLKLFGSLSDDGVIHAAGAAWHRISGWAGVRSRTVRRCWRTQDGPAAGRGAQRTMKRLPS